MLILTTGGTIDKVYFDALSRFQIGDSMVPAILKEANVTSPLRIENLLRKDSLDLTDEDRTLIRQTVMAADEERVLITHGTDTMVTTALSLLGLEEKTIVLTGALQPARLKSTDAAFNLGFAMATARLAPPGAWIAMNGEVFDARAVVKDREAGEFVRTEPINPG